MKKNTIQTVADEAGVSITTVSRVVNNNYPVSKKTRAKVESAIKKLGYTPNVLARGLIQKKTFTIGVMTPSIANMFFPAVIDGIQDFYAAKGYQIILCDTGGDSESESKILSRLLERQVDGIISIDPRTQTIQQGDYNNAAQRVPLVLVNGYSEGIPLNYVMNDQRAGAKDAVDYLVSLGHKKIAFFRDRTSYSNTVKEEAYRDAMKQHGLDAEIQIVRMDDGNDMETFDRAKKSAVHYLKRHPAITAICACNDWMAAGIIHAANELRISVPEALSVIGYDNSMVAKLCVPALTTVDQRMKRLGNSASLQLLNIIEGTSEGYARIIYDTQLVKRESCGPAKSLK